MPTPWLARSLWANKSLWGINSIIGTLLKLTGSKGIITGTGPLKDDRTSTQTIINSDGLLQTLSAGTVPFENARYVRNYTIDLQTASVFPATTVKQTGLNDVFGGTNALSINKDTGAAAGIYRVLAEATPGALTVLSVYLRASSPCQVQLKLSSSGALLRTVNVGTVWARYAAAGTVVNNSDGIYITTSDAVDLFICAAQQELGVSSVSEYVDNVVMYNAGIAGVKIFDTVNATTVDANGVVTEAVGAPLAVKPRIVAEPSAINLFVNPLAPATQTIALSAGTYSIYIRGTGSITLSGGATGTVTSAAKLTFTTTGSTTFTVSGTVTDCNVVAGDRQSSIITTTSRAANNLNLPRIGNMLSNKGLFAFRFKRGYTGESHINSIAEVLLQSTGINILTKLANTDTYRLSDGTNNADITAVTGNMTNRIFAFWYDQTLGIMQLGTLEIGGSWVYSPVVAFNGFTFSADILRLYQTISTRFEHIAIVTKAAAPQAAAGFAATRTWVESNLVTELYNNF